MEFDNSGASASVELMDVQKETLSQEVGADYQETVTVQTTS